MTIFQKTRACMAALAAFGLLVSAPAQGPATVAPSAQASAKVAKQPNIVLILANHVRPFLFQHTNHTEGDVLDADGFTDGIGRLK